MLGRFFFGLNILGEKQIMFSRIMDLKIIVEGVNLKARSDFLKFAAGFGFETNSEAANLWTTCGGSSQVIES